MRTYRLALQRRYTVKAFPKRSFCATSQDSAGHSRWSNIRHDKGKNDAAKNKQRTLLAKEIEFSSRMYGTDPTENNRLAAAITNAKKAGFPKASIAAAIARGQGFSPTGAALETVSVEALLPRSVGVVIECQTDSKIRTLNDIRQVIKKFEGNVTPTQYLFEKKGRVIFAAKEGVSVDTILEEAIEAGALDVAEGRDGTILVFTEPSDVNSISQGMGKQLDLEIKAADIIWDPNEDTKIPFDDAKTAGALSDFVDALGEIQGIQAVYMNVAQGSLDKDSWEDFQSTLEM